MNVNVHIKRLILHDIDVDSHQRRSFQCAIEQELVRLLTTGGVANELLNGGAIPRLAGSPAYISRGNSSIEVGQRIAGSVYGGIGK